MSNNTTNATRNAVFVAARAQGKSTTLVIDAVKACKLTWLDKVAVASIADAYKAGRVSASLGVTEKQALTILALKPHKDGATPDGMRTFSEHMACRAAISAWSTIRLLAGAPSAQNGNGRTPRATKANEEEGKALPDTLLPALVRAKSESDVHAYALRVAGNVKRYLNMNDKYAKGDIGEALRSFVANVAKASKNENESEAKAA